MKKFAAVAVSLAVVASIIGCADTNPVVGPGQATAPTLPPTASMEIPSFAGEEKARSYSPETNYAFTLAYAAVSYWTATVQLGLLEPFVLFKLCHNAQPVPLPDNSGWVWSISDGNGCSAKLTGQVKNSEVHWSMSVRGGTLTDFVWFTGVSSVTGRTGSWTFYDTAAVNGAYPPVIQFEYEVTNVKSTVKVTVVDAAGADKGSYLRWTEQGRAMTFEAFGAQKNELAIIAWDKITEAGYISNPATGEKYCWDTKWNGHQDIACP